MNIQLFGRTAAYVAGLLFTVSSAFASPGATDASPIVAKPSIIRTWESFSVVLNPVANTSTIQLVIQKPIGKKVWITFRSPGGDVIDRVLTDKNAAGVFRKYNFSDAEEGTYSFEITDGKQTETRKVSLQSMTVKTMQQLIVGK